MNISSAVLQLFEALTEIDIEIETETVTATETEMETETATATWLLLSPRVIIPNSNLPSISMPYIEDD